mmetsp:Transcript_117116/g.268884  ORF Transcript_117116/g.268884 Transcript_117116/m.268884 type:complete len:411 (-) Transcript_117116:2206-3438(-)
MERARVPGVGGVRAGAGLRLVPGDAYGLAVAVGVARVDVPAHTERCVVPPALGVIHRRPALEPRPASGAEGKLRLRRNRFAGQGLALRHGAVQVRFVWVRGYRGLPQRKPVTDAGGRGGRVLGRLAGPVVGVDNAHEGGGVVVPLRAQQRLLRGQPGPGHHRIALHVVVVPHVREDLRRDHRPAGAPRALARRGRLADHQLRLVYRVPAIVHRRAPRALGRVVDRPAAVQRPTARPRALEGARVPALHLGEARPPAGRRRPPRPRVRPAGPGGVGGDGVGRPGARVGAARGELPDLAGAVDVQVGDLLPGVALQSCGHPSHDEDIVVVVHHRPRRVAPVKCGCRHLEEAYQGLGGKSKPTPGHHVPQRVSNRSGDIHVVDLPLGQFHHKHHLVCQHCHVAVFRDDRPRGP